MARLKEIVADLQKKHGKGIGGIGLTEDDVPRLSTGIFELDYALGGGLPMGRIIEVFGMESSGKTNLLLCSMASYLRRRLDEYAAFVDLEHALDHTWAARLGTDTSRVAPFEPYYGEQMVDLVEDLILAEDVGIIGVDSLAATMSLQELNKSAEGDNPGRSGLLIGKLIRKSVQALATAAKDQGRTPTVILLNQIRHKVGVMYGSPETTSGGNAPKFAASLRLRLHGSDVMDEKVNKDLPIRKKTEVTVRKWKVPLVARKATYEMVMIPHDGMDVGECYDWPSVSNMLRDRGLLGKVDDKKGGWFMLDEKYGTLTACKAKYTEDRDFADEVKAGLIAQALKEARDGDNYVPPQNPGEVVNPETGEVTSGA